MSVFYADGVYKSVAYYSIPRGIKLIRNHCPAFASQTSSNQFHFDVVHPDIFRCKCLMSVA